MRKLSEEISDARPYGAYFWLGVLCFVGGVVSLLIFGRTFDGFQLAAIAFGGSLGVLLCSVAGSRRDIRRAVFSAKMKEAELEAHRAGMEVMKSPADAWEAMVAKAEAEAAEADQVLDDARRFAKEDWHNESKGSRFLHDLAGFQESDFVTRRTADLALDAHRKRVFITQLNAQMEFARSIQRSERAG